MRIVHDLVQEFLWSIGAAVSIGEGDEKDLLRRELL
jgi:hypothetical protein